MRSITNRIYKKSQKNNKETEFKCNKKTDLQNKCNKKNDL